MFDTFRRHRKKWLAALVIMCMFAFSFSMLLSPNGDEERRRRPQVVDTIFGRDVTDVDLANVRFSREIANAFVREGLFAVSNDPRVLHPQVRYFGDPNNVEALKHAIRLTHKADELGVTVRDAMIQSWITEITDGRLSTGQFQQVVERLKRYHGGLTPQYLFNILREQLRIKIVNERLGFGMFGGAALQVTPYEAWQFYRRLNEKVGLEVVPVAVADFADQAGEPSQRELEEFFAKYVGRLPDETSPEPGFKEPHRMQLQYAHASLKDFALAMKPQVTAEEIQEYYEKNKDFYRDLPKPPSSEPKPPSEATPEKPEAAPEKSQKGETSGDKPAAEPSTPPEESKKTPAPPKAEDGDKTPPAKPDSPPKSDSPESDPDEFGSDADDSEQETPKESSPPQQPPAAPPKSDSGQQPPQKDTAKDPGGQTEPKKDSTPPADAAQKAQDAATPKQPEPPRYKPLEEVTPEIRDELANRKARAEILKRLEQVRVDIYAFAEQYQAAKIEFEESQAKNKNATFQPPDASDFLARVRTRITELGMQFGQTELITATDLGRVEGLGESLERTGEFADGGPVAVVMKDAELYDPRDFMNFKDDFYTVWKSVNQPEREPTLDEVRDAVEAAYRRVQARAPARQRAEQLADSLRGLGGNVAKLREAHPEIATFTIDLIPLWSNAPQLSPANPFALPDVVATKLPNIEHPSKELHETVFKLKQGEVGVVWNRAEDTYYVVAVTKREPASREDFARSRILVEAQLQTIRGEDAAAQWIADVRRESGSKVTAPSGN